MWSKLVEWIREWPLEKKLLDSEDVELLFVTNNYDEAFTVIKEAHEDFSRGGTNFCLNYHMYKPKR